MRGAEARIAQGSADGSLSSDEQSSVNGTLSTFQTDKANAMADGNVSPQEDQQLRAEMANLNSSIAQFRHN